MTMSKQDFEFIAERIFTLPAIDGRAFTDVEREMIADHFAAGLRSTNGMFQRDKFVRAAVTGQHIRRSILPRP